MPTPLIQSTTPSEKLSSRFDNLRPGLNLVASTQQKNADTSDSLTLRNARDTATVGAQVDLNLDKLAAENDYRRALLVLQQQRRGYELMRDTVILEVRKAYRDMAEAAERYKVQSEELNLAKQRFESTMSLLGYGRANTRTCLTARKTFTGPRTPLRPALVNYTVAMLGFYRDVEILQVRPDGMWETALATGAK